MNDFTASNGVKISLDVAGDYKFEGNESLYDIQKGGSNEQALREFFRAEDDARLGRWRWPENPDIYVCGESVGFVTVVDEKDPANPGTWERHWHDVRTDLDRAGRAYFDAHPEPKPWHDAADGETWALTVNGIESAWVFRKSEWERISDGYLLRGAPASPAISAGRRIWPEVAS